MSQREVPKELSIQLSMAIYRQCMVQTQACLLRDLIEHQRINQLSLEHGGPKFSLHYAHSANDALVGRCRSRIATMFLQSTKLPEVLVMVDGDMEWPSGAVQLIAQRAYQEQAIVGAIVPKRATGEGCAIAFTQDFNNKFKEGEHGIEIGTPGVIRDVEYIGAAFTAYPKVLFQRLIDQEIVRQVTQSFYPFFMETVIVDYPMEGMHFHVSEDWYICHLARKVDVPIMAETGLIIKHLGEKAYTVEDAWLTKKEGENIDGKPTPDAVLRDTWKAAGDRQRGEAVEGEQQREGSD